MGKKISVVVIVVILVWIGLRLIVAERNTDPYYRMDAGKDYVQREWDYHTRFDNETDPVRLTTVVRTINYFNNLFFRMSIPIFWVENRVAGQRIGKGDASFDQFLTRVGRIQAKGWDYAISANRDGRGLNVVKSKALVETVE